jgi:ketosteroid isomerase-like protein
MKKNILVKAVLIILFIGAYSSLSAQQSHEKVKSEITEALKTWNAAAKSANVEQCMILFDDSEDMMLIGSDKGEVNKGKAQVRELLTRIFDFASFSWQMDSINIDYNGNTAWVFVEGKMIVDFKKGGTNITPYRFTGILVKNKGKWKWRLFDGSIPRGER